MAFDKRMVSMAGSFLMVVFHVYGVIGGDGYRWPYSCFLA